MHARLGGWPTFLNQFFRNYHTTGAIAPSGRLLASRLARFVVDDGQAKRVLEVGPGTGAVTRAVARALGPRDELDLVELNDAFVEFLKGRFAADEPFRRIADRSRILHRDVATLDEPAAYDVIISGLPLNNFSPAEVERILESFMRLLKPGGTLSFFQYIFVRRAKAAVSGRAERRRLDDIGRILDHLLEQHEVRRDWVWPNLPPAWVHHLRFS